MYAIELPKELLGRLAQLRAKTGKPIARQVREALQAYREGEEARTAESRQLDAERMVGT